MTTIARVQRLVAGTMVAVVLAGPVALAGQAATTLPAGGGEPGKVYMAAQKAVKAQDIPALKKLMSAARVKQMDAPDFKQMLGMVAEMMPTELKVTGGTQTGDTATLTLSGKMGTELQKGDAILVKEGGAWRLDKENWKN
jgi:translation initiation factor IF-1